VDNISIINPFHSSDFITKCNTYPDLREAVTRLNVHRPTFSGSLALVLENYLAKDRYIHDIDLVFPSKEAVEAFTSKIDGLTCSFPKIINPLYERTTSSLYFTDLRVKIDVFINVEEDILAYPNITISNPRRIIQRKLNILLDRIGTKDDTYAKHYNDLQFIMRGTNGSI